MKKDKIIVVNARFLTQRITGVQRFGIELSIRLKKQYGDEIIFVTHPGIIHKELAKELNAIEIGISKSHLWEQIDLYLFLLQKGNPLLVSFGFTGPILYGNQIITIHDMSFLYYRKSFSRAFAMAYNFIIPKLAKKCLHVLTVSNSSKKDIVKELNIPLEKVTIVYNGLSKVFSDNNNVNKIIDNKERYILTVSSHHPRKNYKRLIKAFSKIDNDDLKLYVIGNKISLFSNSLNDNDYMLDKRVIFLRNISDEELALYYENSELFIYPSLYEGFGIPVIEAMSKGKTCVLSDIPVFREIGDDQVVYVDPLDVNSIRKGIEFALKSNCKKEYAKLKDFTWDNSAKKVQGIFEAFK